MRSRSPGTCPGIDILASDLSVMHKVAIQVKTKQRDVACAVPRDGTQCAEDPAESSSGSSWTWAASTLSIMLPPAGGSATTSGGSLWLNSGVPAIEVVRRAGHRVAVLLKVYAHCIDGQANEANRRINDALGTHDSQSDPADEGDGEDEQAS